jgi:hypothetical protein
LLACNSSVIYFKTNNRIFILKEFYSTRIGTKKGASERGGNTIEIGKTMVGKAEEKKPP